jgi:hypothetical protein
LSATAPAAPPVRYLHRRSRDADIYFLSTASAQPVRFRADFRVGQRQPELWDPVTGVAIMAPAFRTDATRTLLDLTLGDAGAIFVVLRHAPPARHPTEFRTSAGKPVTLLDPLVPAADGMLVSVSGESLLATWSDGRSQTLAMPAGAPSATVLAGPWAVTFTPPSGRTFTREFADLQSWTSGADELKYFSGAATYRSEFLLPADTLRPDRRVLLDLGAVHDLATPTINGRTLATLWTPPFRADVTSALRPGRNVIEIEVRNRWVNRLMGDDRLPQDIEYQQKLKTGRTWGIIAKFPTWLNDPVGIAGRARQTFTTYQTYYKPEHVLPVSGLLGPVTVRFVPVVTLGP